LVQGGQGDLEQLFLNLATNARDAMPKGGRLSLAARNAGDGVEVTIADTGCGIPADHLERVFMPFFTTKENGNGLGLAICRSIGSGLSGKLDIASELGLGTRVRVILPTVRAADARDDA